MKIAFTDKSIDLPEDSGFLNDTGAELIFLGRVRAMENGIPIVALEYEYYPGMAETKLKGIASELLKKYDIQDIECVHRYGKVPVGEASISIVIRSGHRAAGLLAMDRFINELKKEVPIWKWGITKEGKKFPSETREQKI